MDKMEMVIETLKVERDYSERQVLKAIHTLRGILDRIERDVQDGEPNADSGLQGNEWRLYKDLSNLEQQTEFLKQLEKIQGSNKQ